MLDRHTTVVNLFSLKNLNNTEIDPWYRKKNTCNVMNTKKSKLKLNYIKYAFIVFERTFGVNSNSIVYSSV